MKHIVITFLFLVLVFHRNSYAQCSIHTEQIGHRHFVFTTNEPLYQNGNGSYTIGIGSFGMSIDTVANVKVYVLDLTIISPINNRLIPRSLTLYASDNTSIAVNDGQGQEESTKQTRTDVLVKQSYYFFLNEEQADFLFNKPIKTIQIYDPRRADSGLGLKTKYDRIIKDQLSCVKNSL